MSKRQKVKQPTLNECASKIYKANAEACKMAVDARAKLKTLNGVLNTVEYLGVSYVNVSYMLKITDKLRQNLMSLMEIKDQRIMYEKTLNALKIEQIENKSEDRSD